MKINQTIRSKYLVDHEDGTLFKIPSQKFPLNSNPILITSQNTFELEDETIEGVFDSIKPRFDDCYYNSMMLTDELLKAGVNPQRIKTYAGWAFNGYSEPRHHSIVVIDDRHVLDFGICRCSAHFLEGDFFPELQSENFFGETKNYIKKPNSYNFIFGKLPDFSTYIMSECSPKKALRIKNRLESVDL